jgi:hypothetical protein
MIDSLIRMLGALIVFLERMKGRWTLKEVKHPRNNLGRLSGFSVQGYGLEIYCHRRHYRRHYDKWFIPNKDRMAFHVFSMVSPDAPDMLQKACELVLDIPQFLPSYASDEAQREAAVQAYLDILIERLGPLRDEALKSLVVKYQD